MTQQSRLLALSTNTAHESVEGAGYIDLLIEEKYAAETARGILAVVESVRTGRSLSS
jgi:hypothetical protein